MTISLNDMRELANKQVFLATVLYLNQQSWGTYVSEMAEVKETEEDAQKWLDNTREAFAVVHCACAPVTIRVSLGEAQNSLVRSLHTEKDHMRKQMAEALDDLEDRISKVLAITHEPEPEPEPVFATINLQTEELFVETVIKKLLKHQPDWVYYIDEEDDKYLHSPATDQSIFPMLHQCDIEAVKFAWADNTRCTLQLVWGNAWDETISDYSYSNRVIRDTVELAIAETRKELTDDSIPF